MPLSHRPQQGARPLARGPAAARPAAAGAGIGNHAAAAGLGAGEAEEASSLLQEDGSALSEAIAANGYVGAGARGEAVREIQQLIGLPAAQCDGVWGPKTTRAVVAWQKAHGLGSDGKVGPATLAAMRASGPAPAAEEEAPAQEGPPADLNKAILAGANAYRGTSTKKGPDGGNLACAWAVNNVLAGAIGRKIGANTNYVPSVEEGLQKAAKLVAASKAEAGDIVVSGDAGHIGIYLGGGRVLSNSSSKRAFVWESDLSFDGFYKGKARIYRIQAE